jgi:uncharacterized protein (DUF2062 family)
VPTDNTSAEVSPNLSARLRSGLGRAFSWLFRLRGSPEAIAGGVALGTFIAVTPTLGIQVWLATVLATLLNANRPAAITMVFLTNPFTAVPLFLLTYRMGLLFVDGPPPSAAAPAVEAAVSNIGALDPRSLVQSVQALASMGREVMLPTTIGGVLLGVLLAGPAYLTTLRLVRLSRRRLLARRMRDD